MSILAVVEFDLDPRRVSTFEHRADSDDIRGFAFAIIIENDGEIAMPQLSDDARLNRRRVLVWSLRFDPEISALPVEGLNARGVVEGESISQGVILIALQRRAVNEPEYGRVKEEELGSGARALTADNLDCPIAMLYKAVFR